MRIILYLIDGLSGQKIPTINNNIVNQYYKNELTYIDELIKSGHTLSRCYGYDNTQSSLYALFTGQDIVNSQVSSTRYADLLLDFGETLAEKFVKKGWSTTFFSSNYAINKGIIYRGFQKIFHNFEDYNIENALKKFPEFKKRVFGENTFVFLHDFYTHDQNGKYSKGKTTYTDEEYQALISENAELLKKNLEIIEFKQDKDILLLFSDHGMTTGSELFDPSNPEKEKLWSFNSKEFKAKVLCSFIGRGISAKIDQRLFTLSDLHQSVLQLTNCEQAKENSIFNSTYNQKFICMANFGNGTAASVDRRQMRQFVCIEKDKKFIYQDNLNKDAQEFSLSKDSLEMHGVSISYSHLPTYFTNYIEKYQNSRKNNSPKVLFAYWNNYVNFLSIKHYIKNPMKVFKFFKKKFGLTHL